MIRLYSGSGSGEIELLGQGLSEEEWTKICRSTVRLLRARGEKSAADLLQCYPWEVRSGTNSFGDDFCILYWSAPLEEYVGLAEREENSIDRQAFSKIAGTITEIGPYIRFIAVALDTKSGPEPVNSPSLKITSDAVERALVDAEHLIHSSGATSGLDRVHTAFQGFLVACCVKHKISVPTDASITALFKLLRENHPAFNENKPHATDVDRVTKAMATIVDSLNPLRNKGSLAHPNQSLLDESEAMLAINSIRTLLHYLDAKLQ